MEVIATTGARTESETWHLLPYDLGPSRRHFSLGDALVRTVSVPSVWWHATNEPTLILGPTQARTCERPANNTQTSVSRVQRQAGGTAVFATDSVLGLDVALPLQHALVSRDIVESYRWFGQVWVAALGHLGVSAHLVSIERARTTSCEDETTQALLHAACFGSLSPYEVVKDDRKIVGLAQVRRRNGELLQAGIHLDFDADALAGLLAPASRRQLGAALRRHAVGLREIAPGPVSFEDVMAGFRTALRDTMGVRLEESEWPEALKKLAAEK